MSKFGQLSMHACMNQIATLISKNEREVLKKIGHDLEDLFPWVYIHYIQAFLKVFSKNFVIIIEVMRIVVLI